MATRAKQEERQEREVTFQGLIEQLEETARKAGERVSELFEDAQVRDRLDEAGKAIDEARVAVMRRLRGEPCRPVEEMTVRELHELATRREIPGRSSMTKAELIEALRER